MSQRHSSDKRRHRHGAFRLRSLPRTFRPQTYKKDSIRFCPEAGKYWVLWENQELELQWNFLTPQTLAPGRKTIKWVALPQSLMRYSLAWRRFRSFGFIGWVLERERARERCKDSGRKEQPPHRKKVLKSFLLLCRNPKTMTDEIPGHTTNFRSTWSPPISRIAQPHRTPISN
jgi:hypothetical protein